MADRLDHSARGDLGAHRAIHQLAAMVATPEALPEVMSQALHALRRAIPFDLAAIYELLGDELVVRVAEGPLASARVRAHRLQLAAFPTIRRALAQRRPIALEEHDHAGDEGDPYDGILDLPRGHSCMVVPLYVGSRDLGIITLDRMVCGVYSEDAVELAGIYAQLVAIAMLFSETALLLDRYRHQLRRHSVLLSRELGGSDVAVRRLDAAPSAAMRDVGRLARQVARADAPVLITGETGTGKEVVAQAIHSLSPRADEPFVKLNCAAIPADLVESELFGHVKGAFSGADRDRAGRFMTADGGSLLLDEIGDMPQPAQAKLLRVLQEGAFEPVGSDRTVRVDVRIMAATHVALPALVERGAFREDLYYRLAVFPIAIPPLRERREDIAAVALDYLAELGERTGRGPWALSAAARAAIDAHPWPGNVRQLINALERATIVCESGQIQPADLGLAWPPGDAERPAVVQPAPPGAAGRADRDRDARRAGGELATHADNERAYFRALLAATGGRIYGAGGAAERAGLKPTTLQSKLKKLGIDRGGRRGSGHAG